MAAFRTRFNGYAVAWSPFEEGRLAVATAQNFGIIGNGRLHVLQLQPGAGAQEVASFDTADGLYDCCWSEENEHVLLSASGDGSVKLWDASAPAAANPLRSFEEHTHEVYAVRWNALQRNLFASASWDDSVKLWDVHAPVSVRTFREHSYCVYEVAWSPYHAELFASASGDCSVRVWDLREAAATLTIPAHDYEILTLDWNKYDQNVLVTGSVDKSLRVWDVRAPARPLAALAGHAYAVRRARCSPHHPSLLCSSSYDMSVCLWDFKAPGGAPLQRWQHHSEFAVGLDMSVLVDGLVASAGWDELVFAWNLNDHGAPPA